MITLNIESWLYITGSCCCPSWLTLTVATIYCHYFAGWLTSFMPLLSRLLVRHLSGRVLTSLCSLFLNRVLSLWLLFSFTPCEVTAVTVYFLRTLLLNIFPIFSLSFTKLGTSNLNLYLYKVQIQQIVQKWVVSLTYIGLLTGTICCTVNQWPMTTQDWPIEINLDNRSLWQADSYPPSQASNKRV